ncbi:MAG: hypothetical protein J7641_10490 [Cyanobacteria bacterium SID2]|nr:hypothetical protein [Cyanobacteria bacterium SID2]MBP0002505.1 hypothetical protein [Cyanobacteria bacterium SBC]
MAQTDIWTETITGFTSTRTKISDLAAPFPSEVYNAVAAIASFGFEGENVELLGAGVNVTGINRNVVNFDCEMKLKTSVWAEGSLTVTIIAVTA